MCATISPTFIKIGSKTKKVRFINRIFFRSEFQSVSRIVIIIHSAGVSVFGSAAVEKLDLKAS